MRVTFVLPSLSFAGGIRVVAIYARMLQKRGHRVTAVSVPLRRPSLRDQLRALRYRGRFESWKRRKPSHFDEMDDEIDVHVLRRHRPLKDRDLPDADVVVATWWETAEWVSRLSRRKGVKAYFVQGHEIFNDQDRHRAAGTYRLPMHKITISRWLVDLMRNEYDDLDVSIVPNGVDPKLFFAPARGKTTPATVGLLYSSASIKGVDIMVEAFRMATEAVPGLALRAFGAKPQSSHLPLPRGARYLILPRQDQIREIYSGCDAWLFGSREEGFGLPILEAMACRTPVIATPAGAAPELLAAGGGVLVRAEDAADMARAIVHVAQLSEGKWRHMSNLAYDTAMRHSWELSADGFETALLHAIDRRRRQELA